MRFPLLLLAGLAAPITALAQWVNYEPRQTRPLSLSPDGTRLCAVNTPDGRLSVFDVSNPANPAPVLLHEIPVGLDPVSVNFRGNDEAWVVNEVSDAVTVVSLAEARAVAHLAAPDEPADVVFAAGQAFVSCSRNNRIRVFDATTRAHLADLPLLGLHPRALAVSEDGASVYAAFALSGNRSTLLPGDRAPPQPAPTNPALPSAPQVSLIVDASDARLSPAPNLPDHDVVEIQAATRTVNRYFSGAGTLHLALAARPGTNEIWTANTEARNLVRFEPVLKGHAVDNRVSRIRAANGAVTAFDLNPGVDYALFPNPSAQVTALAQPTALVFEPDGAHFWIAAFGSDRLARINANTGAVVQRVETGPTTGAAADPRNKRGPRGLALQVATGRLYALNRFSNTITVIDTATGAVRSESPVGTHDPTPAAVRVGRGFLYDARLSGNGTQSCASCHLDGDRDDLAWDLGDPGGAMQQVQSTVPLVGVLTSTFHPMKGPMTTQTLRGMNGTEPLHWRGDRADVTHFNGAFASLLGGSLLPNADLLAMRDYLHTLAYQPNPNQNLDRSMPASFPPGDPDAGNPNAGKVTYLNTQYQTFITCNSCHSLPTGTGRFLIPAAALGSTQDFKIPQLRNVYQKLHFKAGNGVSLSGFGLVHDGMDPTLTGFFSRSVFGPFATDTALKRNLNAFMQCFDTGTAPAVGALRLAEAGTVAALAADWATLEARVKAGDIDLVLHGEWNGQKHGFVFRPATQDYASDTAGLGPFSRAQVQAALTAGTARLTLAGVPPGTGVRVGTDRDANGTVDGNEPAPEIDIEATGPGHALRWPVERGQWVLECTDSLESPDWRAVTDVRRTEGSEVIVDQPGPSERRYYRLRRP